ncbi:MAG: alpha/beta hydrolase [Solirubrobacteraceae bacterium]|nr:alpha/beta hydrolase [Solirubrobacteraceae bacterium]
MTLGQRALVTACAATGTTERATRRLGAGRFLPALFTQRYANMGGLDAERFREQLDACRSFEDAAWCAYWDDIADAELGQAREILGRLDEAAAPAPVPAPAPLSLEGDGAVEVLTATIAPYARLLADHALLPPPAAVARFSEAHADRSVGERAANVVELVSALLRAITYLQVSAFPGTTAGRMRAYERSRALFDTLASAFAAGLDTIVEQVVIPTGGETVRGYRCLPAGAASCPVVIVTNGLEGTVQELLIPLLRYHASGLGVVVMEMPGSYAYAGRMSPASESVYRGVIDAVVADPRVDARRVGMVGVSFGGYWAARMAAADDRLACVVACGAPTHRSFRPTLGLPEIIIDALAHVTGATTPPGLLRRLRALSLRGRYGEITQPLLVINGDHDTLLSTRDSVDLAAGAANAELLLYPGDDHCAMGHYREWLDTSQRWLAEHLLDGSPADTSGSPFTREPTKKERR